MAGTILIVDDDPIVRQGLRAVLEREGYAVALAANGSEALSYLTFNDLPALIVLDMMMPRMDGWKFLSAFRQTPSWSGVPVIVTTAMGIASLEWAQSQGAVDLLKKPFDEDALCRAVHQVCSAVASAS